MQKSVNIRLGYLDSSSLETSTHVLPEASFFDFKFYDLILICFQ